MAGSKEARLKIQGRRTVYVEICRPCDAERGEGGIVQRLSGMRFQVAPHSLQHAVLSPLEMSPGGAAPWLRGLLVFLVLRVAKKAKGGHGGINVSVLEKRGH